MLIFSLLALEIVVLLIDRCGSVGVSGDGYILLEEPIIVNDKNINSIFKDIIKNSHQVGDIVKSVLKEEEFVQLHGNKWVLLDGRELDPGDKLRVLTGWTHLPNSTDAHYQVNTNNVISSDPLQETVAAPKEMNKTTSLNQEHHHYLKSGEGDGGGNVYIKSTGGSHSHKYNKVDIDGIAVSSNANLGVSTVRSTEVKSHTHPNVEFSGSTASTLINDHQHSFLESDKNTELNSVLVNFFIKIN